MINHFLCIQKKLYLFTCPKINFNFYFVPETLKIISSTLEIFVCLEFVQIVVISRTEYNIRWVQ